MSIAWSTPRYGGSCSAFAGVKISRNPWARYYGRVPNIRVTNWIKGLISVIE
jgi:hypothetical protein